MLEGAGIVCACDRAAVDETAVKVSLRARGANVTEVAEALSAAKAKAVSARHPDAMVIGADQILDCDGVWFEKPASRAEAASHLKTLSGRTHRLISAVCMVRDGQGLWSHVDSARLTMRPLSEAFIADYLDRAGVSVLESVGGYRLEGLGAQLFSEINGDFFTILGMPLLPLLAFLRRSGLLDA